MDILKQSGDHYDGEWKDAMKNGKGVLTYSNGDRYDGEFLNDLRHGIGV